MNFNDLKNLVDSELASIADSKLQTTIERNLLIHHVMGYSPEFIYSNPRHNINQDNESYKTLATLLHRRIKERIPMQYLLGETVFYGLTLKVSPAVLIPRPETELIVEHAVNLCKERSFKKVLELGTGSGCIAITIKKSLPHLEITAVDISDKALKIAKENAALHKAEISFLQGSWFKPVEDKIFDLIISNPPYVHCNQKFELAPEVLKEPEVALFSPGDPLTLYDELINASKQHLNPYGCFLLEIGAGQASELQKICGKAGFETEIFKDYAGLDRIIRGRTCLNSKIEPGCGILR